MKHMIRRLTAFFLCAVLLITSAAALSVEQALGLLDRDYIYNISDEARSAVTLDELFTLLGDPYTYYMSAKEYRQFLSELEGVQPTVGIGVSIQFTENGILILDTVTGGSAQLAGLTPGDLIVEVDGISCVPAAPEHQAMITGEAGTLVTVTVLRDGIRFTYNLVRRQIVIPNVEFSLTDNVGLITCTSFGRDTGADIADCVSQYDSRADFWLLDLRSNPGGYTDSAVAALGAFCGPGHHLYLRTRDDYTQSYFHADHALTEDPVIVLVDGQSASASEAVAAGIRDSGRGIVIGERTFGKGVAQVIYDHSSDPHLFDADALKITAYRFYSSGASTTDMIGVIPTLILDAELAPLAAQALCSSFRDDYTTEGQMMLLLADRYFFLDMADLTPDVASALLSALPPSAQLWVGADEFMWAEITPAEAAVLLQAEYHGRRFDDVETSPYADSINTLATYGLLLGDGSGSFLPGGSLTRAQVCAMLAQMLGVTYEGPSLFTDVPDSAWYASPVNAMARLGFVDGTGGGKFRPDAILTQQEYFTILGRAARFLNFAVDDHAYLYMDGEGNSILHLYPELNGFADWAKESVALLAWSGEVLGHNGSMLFNDLAALSPTSPITRGEAAACLYNVLHFTGILPV